MKFKNVFFVSLFVLFSTLLFFSCSSGGSSGNKKGSEAEPNAAPTLTSAVIQVDDGNSAFNARFLGVFDNVTRMSVRISNGSTLLSTQSLTKTGGTWGGTLDNLTIGVPLNFVGNAYDANNVLIFIGNTQKTLATSGNTVLLYLMPQDDGVTNTFPQVTQITYPQTMNLNDNASIRVFINGSANEKFSYAFTNGGGSFDSLSGNFTLSASSGVISQSYTAPSTAPTSGYVEHRFKITNAQNNSVEIPIRTQIVASSSNVQMSTAFAPVVTGLAVQRTANRAYWTATSKPSTNVSYTWKFNTSNLSGSTASTSMVYASTNTGNLTITIQEAGNPHIVTATYSVPTDMLPDLIVPNGSIIINSHDNETSSNSVNLALSAADTVGGVTGYYVSENATTPSANATGWVNVGSTTSYTTNPTFTLSTGYAYKTIYVWFKDLAGHVSTRQSDGIDYSANAYYHDFNGSRYWQQDDGVTRNYTDASTYCSGLTLSGFSDWRVPNITELQSIVVTGQNPSINSTYFPNTKSNYYWSSTRGAYSSLEHQGVSFVSGNTSPRMQNRYSYYVRCVRNG